jgi:diketogulonate reductase-like aldo/keto reductase
MAYADIPRILYGTAWKKELTAGFVDQALQLGFRGIDTACQPRHYHEPGVGAGVAAFLQRQGRDGLDRSALYLQTKFTPLPGQDPNDVPYAVEASPADQVAQSFRRSLDNLRTSYVDCLVLHSPIAEAAQMAEVWGAMEAIVATGGARRIGISNCYSLAFLTRLYHASRIKPSVVQNRFYDRSRYDREIRAFCVGHGIVYQSFWTLTANPQLLAHPTMARLAQHYRRTPAQILFRYLTQSGVVPLTGTTSVQHMREALEIFSFDLSAADRAAVTGLL